MSELIRRTEPSESKSRSDMDPAEWEARVNVAACYRLIAHFGKNFLTYNHISYRLPSEKEGILINSFGLMFDEVCASNLVKVNLDGDILDDPLGKGINEAGYVIHSALHRARSDVACVIHTHTPAGCAVSAQKHGLLPVTQDAMLFYGSIGYHTFESFAIDLAERERLAQDLGEHRVMILRNHGLLTAGRTIAEAFHDMMLFEFACRTQVDALSGGAELTKPSSGIGEKTAKTYRDNSLVMSEYAWPAMRRLADRLDESYKS